MLRAAGIQVVLHDDVFPAAQKVPDDEWLRHTAEHGLIGVSHDSKIRYTSASRRHSAPQGTVADSEGQGVHDGLARNFVLTYPAIGRFLQRHEAPFIAKVYRDAHDATRPGRVELWLVG